MPGTGKTTLMKKFMSQFEGEWKLERPVELLDSHVNGNIRILGKYEDGEVFAGTDRLSMAVQPKVLEYLNENESDHIVFEGDRLTSINLFKQIKSSNKHQLHILSLVTSDEVRQERYELRGSNQSEKFINGRATKIQNIKDMYSGSVLFGEDGCFEEWVHETPADTDAIINRLKEILF